MIINPVMCVFCVKVYCVAKFCSPFPGNGREAERNKTESVTIKTIFLKNNIGERGEAETGETHSCAFPFDQTTTKSTHFYRLERLMEGIGSSPMIHVHVRESEQLYGFVGKHQRKIVILYVK